MRLPRSARTPSRQQASRGSAPLDCRGCPTRVSRPRDASMQRASTRRGAGRSRESIVGLGMKITIVPRALWATADRGPPAPVPTALNCELPNSALRLFPPPVVAESTQESPQQHSRKSGVGVNALPVWERLSDDVMAGGTDAGFRIAAKPLAYLDRRISRGQAPRDVARDLWTRHCQGRYRADRRRSVPGRRHLQSVAQRRHCRRLALARALQSDARIAQARPRYRRAEHPAQRPGFRDAIRQGADQWCRQRQRAGGHRSFGQHAAYPWQLHHARTGAAGRCRTGAGFHRGLWQLHSQQTIRRCAC